MVRISNKEIIRLLEMNSKITYVKLARKFGVTETAIRKRIKNLVKKGVIKKFTIEVDPKKLGYSVVSLIGIDTLPEKFLSVINNLKKNENIKKMYSSSGDHMILVEVWFKSSDELNEFVENIEKIEGITKVCPAILLERIK